MAFFLKAEAANCVVLPPLTGSEKSNYTFYSVLLTDANDCHRLAAADHLQINCGGCVYEYE